MNPQERFDKNKKLVFFVLKRMKNLHSTNLSINTIEFEDAEQLGMIGLWKACKSYDEKKGNKFSTYAVPAITGEIINVYRDNHGTIKLPRQSKIISKKLLKMLDNDEKLPSNEEIQKEYNVSEDIARCALEILELRILSASAPIKSQSGIGRELHLADMVADENALFENDIIKNEQLREILSLLNDREKEVIHLLLKEKTQSEVGKVLGISQVHVNRIYKKVINKAKNYYEVDANENKPQSA